MGNRAVITTSDSLNEMGIYLHWNGGRDSVEGFLAYCQMKGFAEDDEQYGFACLCGVIFNTFGNGTDLGLDIAHNLDCNNYDNGVFIIKGFDIVGRKYHDESCEQLEYDLREFVKNIDDAMPEKMRLTKLEWDKFDKVKERILLHRDNKEHEHQRIY